MGRDLFLRGLISSHAGNISIRSGKRLIITRTGSMLGHLEKQDLVETGIEADDEATPLASIELAVHRAIYKETPAQAVVHAHPPHAIALSLAGKEILPIDSEGAISLEKVPVLGWGARVQPGELAEDIAQALRERSVIMVHGHGSFAMGSSLEEAYRWTSTLEGSCRIICLYRSFKAQR